MRDMPYMQLKILYITGSLYDMQSGPYGSLLATARHLAMAGHQCMIIGTRDAWRSPELSGNESFKMVVLRKIGPYSMHYAPSLRGYLRRMGEQWHALSLQSIWQLNSYQAARWSVRRGLRYMVTGHGNFNAVALARSSVKKYIGMKSYVHYTLSNASAFQALNQREAQAMRDFGIRKPIFIIPNGVSATKMNAVGQSDGHNDEMEKRPYFLYLGRLHPIKGIESLLQAWKMAGVSSEYRLVIAGSGHPRYERALRNLSQSLNLDSSVVFLGRLSPDSAQVWLRNAHCMVLVSKSEGLPMAVLEGFACGTPAILTLACGLPEIESAGAGYIYQDDINSIAVTLCKAAEQNEMSRKIQSENCRRLAQTTYSWSRIINELVRVYSWLAGQSDLPNDLLYNL